MKKVLLALAIVTVGFTACQKEETPEKTTAQKITGTWKGDEQTVAITGFPSETTDLSYVNFNFKSDGTYTSDSAGVNAMSGTWSVPNNNTIILDSLRMDIVKLSDTQFHMGLDTTLDFFGTPLNMNVLLKLKK